MKKTLLLAAALLITLVSCQKEEGPAVGELQQIVVNIPQSAQTRAAGDGSSINRCILEIYSGTTAIEKKYIKVEGKTATFNVALIPSQTYEFVLWADHVANPDSEEGLKTDDKYNTTDLTAITLKDGTSYKGNDESYDAFYGHVESYTVNGTFNTSVDLTRPFGQLAVNTLDIADIQADFHKPNYVKVTFSASTPLLNSFDAKTGEASGSETTRSYTVAAGDLSSGALTVDYLLAPATGNTLVDFTMEFYNEDPTTNDGATPFATNSNFTNIPIQRNYQTNVTGNLVTKKGTVTIDVSTDFTTGSAGTISFASTLADAQSLLSQGATNVILTSDITSTTPTVINLPKAWEAGETLELSLTGTISSDITIQYLDNGSYNYPANIILKLNCPNNALTINTPNSTVRINGKFGSISAATATRTLIVEEEAVVQTLKVLQGNVEIYGAVNNLTLADGSIITLYSVGDAATLVKASEFVSAKQCAKIVLTNNIDLKDVAYPPMYTADSKFEEFDGAGYTIRNLTIDNYTGNENADPNHYDGLFYVLQGTIKNLTLENADVKCWRGGALVGRMDYGTIENCHVKNATVTSQQKIGGLVGYVNTSSKDVTIRGCSVDNFTAKPLPDEIDKDYNCSLLYQVGGLVGYLQSFDRNVLVENCSVSNISITSGIWDASLESTTELQQLLHLEQCYYHSFIGNIVNVSSNSTSYDTYSVVLRNNKVDKQLEGVPTCDRTDEYIGWWAGDCNTGKSYATKLIVDDVVKDRWIEIKRMASLIEAGGEVSINRNYDFARAQEAIEKITISKPTTLNTMAVVTVGSQQFRNESELTIKNTGTNAAGGLTGTDYLIMNDEGATLTIENGAFTATKVTNANGTIIYNHGGTVTIKGGEFSSPHYVILSTSVFDAGDRFAATSVTITGGNLKNTGTYGSYAVLVSGQNSGIEISGGKIDGLLIEDGATAKITDGTLYNDDKYNGIYIGRNDASYAYPTVTISGGYFSGYDTNPSILNTAGTGATNLTITGGYFKDNSATVAENYQYVDNVQTVDGITYNYEVQQQ